MNFLPTELNVTDYMQRISDMLNDKDCHVFIDTNILSQLYKLNDKARGEFLSWADSIQERFHIPNWVVMEYNKRAKKRKLGDYVDDLGKIKSIKKELANLQRFLWGYVDDDILQGSEYQGRNDDLHDQFKNIVNDYSAISDAVTKKSSGRLKKVECELKNRLDQYVLDTDIYIIMQNANQHSALRFENQIPPGCADSEKESNRTGDLIIWHEILECCRRNTWSKVIFISRDLKDQYFMPEVQEQDGKFIKDSADKINIAHESLVYEFSLATGSRDLLLVDFTTLVRSLSDKYTELAFSFQMVSHATPDVEEDGDDCILVPVGEEAVEEVAQPAPPVAGNNRAEENAEYTLEALHDTSYIETCSNAELKACIIGLRSHNWYSQNDAVDDLHKLLIRNWQETQEYKDAFFVIGRNLLQSADGNSFEAVRFIRNMSDILGEKPEFIRKAIVDGCLYEVFFNSNGEIRPKEFKARYLKDVIESVQAMGLNNPFDFVNKALDEAEGDFIPRLGDDQIHTFHFTFTEPSDKFDYYHTQSLEIDGKDVSASFSNHFEGVFAEADEIKEKLSQRYAVDKEHIRIEGLNDDIRTVRYIKQNDVMDENLFDL